MLKGSCLCGGIGYEIDGDLGPAMICHCSKCRKANGSAFAVNAQAAVSDFRIVRGRELLSEYESSPGVFRTFCQRCASPLYSRRPSMPDAYRLRVGTLDSEVDIRPQAHIFVASKASWDPICDHIPQFAERP